MSPERSALGCCGRLPEDAFDVSLFDRDGLQRWLSGEQDLFRHEILQPPPEGTQT